MLLDYTNLFTLISGKGLICTQCLLRAVFCIHLFLTGCELDTLATPILQIKKLRPKEISFIASNWWNWN